MKYEQGHQSDNIEDRRGGGGGGLPVGKMGLGGFLILAVLSLIFGKNLFKTFSSTGSGPSTSQSTEKTDFIAFVLDDAQAEWAKTLPKQTGTPYRDAKLVLFTDATGSGCGQADSGIGPFYCPADEKLYIDLGFYDELKKRLGAPGDFAQAYVIAHEIGHHVQKILGTDSMMRNKQRGLSKTEKNELSVMLELQADCYAGVWAHSTQKRDLLEGGDIEEAMGAAAAVGDDRLQKAATGTIEPERWTHGSSTSRVKWFKTGLESGDVGKCDTFNARTL